VPPIDPKLARSFKLAAIAAETLVLVAAALGVIGWAFGIHALKHPTDEPALQSAAALNFVFLSTATLLLCVGTPKLWRRLTGRFLATVVIVSSAATFIEHTCHLYWQDLVLWRSEGLGLTYPGPLLPHESFFFILLGIGVLLFNIAVRKKIYPSQILAVFVFVPSFIVLICYMLGQSHLCIYFGCVQLSPIVSMIFLMQSLGLFFASSDSGAARIFSLTSTTGTLARRTCAALAILIAALLPRQWLISVGESAQLVDAATVNIGTATFALIAVGTFGWWCFRKIEAGETEKQQAIELKDEAIEMLRESEAQETRHLKLVCLKCMAEFSDRTLTHCPHDLTELINIVDVLKPGSLFADSYLIEKELGSGGMSTVYLAEHVLMNKKVAVKVLQAHLASDLTTIQRFQRESQAASSLSHPNLVTVYDFKVTETGQAYMVMEFIEGLSLSELINRSKPMRWREALPLILDICEGLEHAHSKGIIHRDLKPGNVMLLPSPAAERRFTPKIVDFGLAKVWDQAGLQLTHTGEIFGSPLYMCPEQCRAAPMDPRSDIYAMGCLMYAVLTGRPPFEGDNAMETMMMHVSVPPPAMSTDVEVPPWFEQIVQKALAKDPHDRFQTVTEMKAELIRASTADN